MFWGSILGSLFFGKLRLVGNLDSKGGYRAVKGAEGWGLEFTGLGFVGLGFRGLGVYRARDFGVSVYST